MDKYEYLTGEDLQYKPDAVQKERFEYSPLHQVFNKGLNFNDNQEGLLKRLKNIEDKTDNLLDLIRNQGDRQLDLSGKINSGRTKSIRLQNEKLINLEKELSDKEKDIKKKTKQI